MIPTSSIKSFKWPISKNAETKLESGFHIQFESIVAVGQMLNELIDHIDVYETQGTGKNKTKRLVIYYKFVGYLDIDPTQCRPNYTADIREGVAIEYISCEPPENLKELFPEGYGACDDSFEEEEMEQA